MEVERAVARTASHAAKSRAAMSRRGASVAGSVMGGRGLAGESVYGGDADSLYGKAGAGDDDDAGSVGGMVGDFDGRDELDFASGARHGSGAATSEMSSMAGSLGSLASSRSTAASTTAALPSEGGPGMDRVWAVCHHRDRWGARSRRSSQACARAAGGIHFAAARARHLCDALQDQDAALASRRDEVVKSKGRS